MQCGECGAEHLSAREVPEKGYEWLKPYTYHQDEDEFQQELEPLEEEETVGEAPDTEAPSQGLPRLLVSPAVAHVYQASIQADGRLESNRHDGISVHLLVPHHTGFLFCPCCNRRDLRRDLFRPVRLGAPFLLQTAIPIVLRHLTRDGKSASSLPFDGRRLSSFTDSRQGTARFAAKMQLETERDFVRSLLYHSIADRERPTDHQELDERRQKIIELAQVGKEKPTSAVLAKVLAEERANN